MKTRIYVDWLKSRLPEFGQNPERYSLYQLVPAFIFVFGILGFSLVFVFFYSLVNTAPPAGEVELTLVNYIKFFETEFYRGVFFDSFIIALQVTMLTLLVSYPSAYFIAFGEPKHKNIFLLLLIIPFWINIVIRTFAWQLILGRGGLINFLLVNILGFFNEPLDLLFSQGAITVGLIHIFLPFTVIPIFVSLDRIDKSHIEAAKNLGANRLQAFYEITLPQSLPGASASAMLVFVLSFGAFLVPEMLGGPQNKMIGNIIADMFTRIDVWELGSAISVVFVITVLITVYVFNRIVGLEQLYGGTRSE